MTQRSDNLLALPTGTELVGDYQIQRVLGAGGFGITYLARETPLDRRVTIKEYFPSDFAMREITLSVQAKSEDCREDYLWGLERFIEEAQTLAKFDHSNIIRVFRYFRANNTAYMVLQFEEGESFKSWLARLGRAPRQAELDQIVGPLLDALELIHGHDFLHRDIAPDNIIIRNDGVPVLIDFGSARGEMVQLSKTVSALVKPGYSPYEQYALTGRSQGPWTDIYSLGATLYQAVTGRRPTDSPARIMGDDYKPAAEGALSSYRPAFLRAIDRALELKVENRPQSIADWRRELLHRKAATARPNATAAAAPVASQRLPAITIEPIRPAPRGVPPAPSRQPKASGIGFKGRLVRLLEAVAKTPRPPAAPPAGLATAARPSASSRALTPAPAAPPVTAAVTPRVSPPKTPNVLKPAMAAPARPALEIPKRDPAARSPLEARRIAPNVTPRGAAKAANSAAQKRADGRGGRRRMALPAGIRKPVRSFLRKLTIGLCVAAALVLSQDRIRSLLPAGLLPSPSTVQQPAPGQTARSRPASARRNPETRTAETRGAETDNVETKAPDSKAVAMPPLERSQGAAALAPASAVPEPQPADRAEEMTLRGHAGAVTTLAFSADGGTLVSAGADATLKVWDPKGKLLRTIELGSGPASAMAAMGQRIAVGLSDGTVALWDLERGTKLKSIKRNDALIWSVAFAGEAGRILTASNDWTVTLWDGQTDAGPVHLFEGHGNAVQSVAYSARGTVIVSGSADKTVKLWNAADYSLIRTYRGHKDFISSVAAAADGAHIASGSFDKTVKIWSATEGGNTRTLRGHRGRITGVAFSPDSLMLASASEDGTARLWDWKRGRLIRTLAGHTGAVKAVVFSPDGKRVATAGEDGTVRLWDATAPARVNSKS